MELKWLEDLLALAQADTLSEAAQQRNITQPAFSRRIKAIEDWLGAPVIDRTRRPVRITPAIMNQLDDIHLLVRDLRSLRNEIQSWETAQQKIIIAAQHSLSMALLPPFIAQLQRELPSIVIKLRSGNWDEIYALLMTRQAMLLVAYESVSHPVMVDETLLQKTCLHEDRLIPVARASVLMDLCSRQSLPIIAYPPEVFFGSILHTQLLPALTELYTVTTVCESALVPAIAELATAGVGIAWLPSILVSKSIQTGQLVDLSTEFGAVELQIFAARLKTVRSEPLNAVWEQLSDYKY